jgi:hypothetical protein
MPHYINAMRPQELLDYDDERVLGNADRIFCIFDKKQIDVGVKSMRLQTLRKEFEQNQGNAPDFGEFLAQPAAQYAYGTAFHVAQGIVATAHHVLGAIENELSGVEDITEARFVRRFVKLRESSGGYGYREVYRGVEVVASSEVEDWALIRISPSTAVSPVLPPMKAPQVGDEIYCLGHPVGLPMKLTYGTLTRVEGKELRARIDTFSGNSGSPVFCAKKHCLIGMLSGGSMDFEDGKVADIAEAPDEDGERIIAARYMIQGLTKWKFG